MNTIQIATQEYARGLLLAKSEELLPLALAVADATPDGGEYHAVIALADALEIAIKAFGGGSGK